MIERTNHVPKAVYKASLVLLALGLPGIVIGLETGQYVLADVGVGLAAPGFAGVMIYTIDRFFMRVRSPE